ncbi:MAG TPA: amidohydrolase family protein [Acidimicrobiia bacterium]|nr:amidohydrolase family protein [Acidimicrobiia bacterium]
MNSTTIHTASAVVPVAGPPLFEGAMAVRDGIIDGVGSRDKILAAHPRAEVIDWDGVMIPGLVNAHTHLQYSSFVEVGSTQHPTYVKWSERFVDEYEAREGEDWAATARQGVEEGIRSGTTCFADIVTDREALGVLAEEGVPGVAYFEMIGVDLAAWESRVEREVTEILTSSSDDHVRLGLSPHAPYSVDEPVLKAAAALARRLGVRLHVHLAESDTEDSYYRTGTGALAERVTLRVGRPWSVLARGGVGMGAAEFARSCGLLGPDSHMAHGVYLDREGRRILSDAGTYVALCPRSNLGVGIDPPPVADFLTEGAPFAVGTDSRGSSPSLDPMADVALLRQLAVDGGYRGDDLDRRLLEAATIGGATALGLDHLVGTLEPGKRADFAFFEVDPRPERVERAVVEGAAGNCIATVVAGRVRHRR